MDPVSEPCQEAALTCSGVKFPYVHTEWESGHKGHIWGKSVPDGWKCLWKMNKCSNDCLNWLMSQTELSKYQMQTDLWGYVQTLHIKNHFQ